MVRVPIKQARSLTDLYRQLVAGQKQAHGPDYCRHHDVIRRLAHPAAIYAEIGVNQGATLACAILAGFERVVGVDIALSGLAPFTGLFAGLATLLEQDHLVPLPGPVDFLLLDCAHTIPGLRAELEVHGPKAKRLILLHDTGTHPALHDVARDWAERNNWTVQERSSLGAGHTLLRRRV